MVQYVSNLLYDYMFVCSSLHHRTYQNYHVSHWTCSIMPLGKSWSSGGSDDAAARICENKIFFQIPLNTFQTRLDAFKIQSRLNAFLKYHYVWTHQMFHSITIASGCVWDFTASKRIWQTHLNASISCI
jgi:hypothetical protein